MTRLSLPPVPLQRGAPVVERDRLQPGESVAAAGVAKPDRQLVADQPATAAGEDRRQAGQARAVLLADAGREPSHTAAVWEHGAADRCPGGGDGVDGGDEHSEVKVTRA